MRVRLGLGPPGPGGARVRHEPVPAGRTPEPVEAALRHGKQLLQVRGREPPAAGLGEHGRKGEGGLDARAAGREVRARVPEGPLEAAGLGSTAGELGAPEGAQGGGGEPGAEGQGHPGRPERFGGDRSAAPGDSGREVDVGGVGRVALEQGPQVVDGGAEQFRRAWVVSLGAGLGEEVTAGPSGTRTRGGGGAGGRLPAHAEPECERRSGRQLGFPAQDARRRQGVHGRRVRGDGDGSAVAAGPPQSGAVDARGEFGAGSPGRHRAQIREIRAQGDLHGEPERPGRGAAQGDPLGPVGAPRAFDGEGGIGPGVARDAQGTEEHRPVGGRHAALQRDGLTPRHPQDAAGQEPSPRVVHPLGSFSGELAVLGADGEGGQRHAEKGAVHRGKFRGTRRAR